VDIRLSAKTGVLVIIIIIIITARRYASAVYAVILRPSVRLSVRHTPVLHHNGKQRRTNGPGNLVF